MGFWMTLLTWVLARLDEWRRRHDVKSCGGFTGRDLDCH